MNIEHLKAKLEEEKVILEEELSRLGIKDPVTGDWGARIKDEDNEPIPDSIDMGDVEEDFSIASNILGELEIRYTDVLNALKKIEHGGYGICEVSGEPIEEDRLLANPAARTCKHHM